MANIPALHESAALGSLALKKVHIKEEHLASDWADWLHRNGLDTFDAWWNLPLVPVDEGNRDGDGWSTVSFFSKDDKCVYVKRQSNYLIRNHASPLFAIPTVQAEQSKIGWYSKAGIPAISTVYFGLRKSGKNEQAILVTEALTGFTSLDSFCEMIRTLNPIQQATLIKSVGTAVCRLHAAGMLHHNLYPKHIFVKEVDGGWQIRFIDLETSRPHFGLMPRKLRDLETLLRRANGWSKTDKLRFLLAYQGVARVDGNVRDLVKLLLQRGGNKSTLSRFELPTAVTRRSVAIVRTIAAFFGI